MGDPAAVEVTRPADPGQFGFRLRDEVLVTNQYTAVSAPPPGAGREQIRDRPVDDRVPGGAGGQRVADTGLDVTSQGLLARPGDSPAVADQVDDPQIDRGNPGEPGGTQRVL